MARSTGLEPVGRAIGNLKQDALLPAIALIPPGFFLPSRPTPFPREPPRTTLEGHTGGTFGTALSTGCDYASEE